MKAQNTAAGDEWWEIKCNLQMGPAKFFPFKCIFSTPSRVLEVQKVSSQDFSCVRRAQNQQRNHRVTMECFNEVNRNAHNLASDFQKSEKTQGLGAGERPPPNAGRTSDTRETMFDRPKLMTS